jgi:hypothetical protein
VAEVDWDKVREGIAKSIRGGELSAEEAKAIKHAWKYRPNEYTRVHAEEKAKAIAEVNPLAGKEE